MAKITLTWTRELVGGSYTYRSGGGRFVIKGFTNNMTGTTAFSLQDGGQYVPTRPTVKACKHEANRIVNAEDRARRNSA